MNFFPDRIIIEWNTETSLQVKWEFQINIAIKMEKNMLYLQIWLAKNASLQNVLVHLANILTVLNYVACFHYFTMHFVTLVG